jgi:AraC-like DNA-binding protein
MAEIRAPLFGRPQKGEGFRHQRIVVLPRAIVAASRRHRLLRSLLPTDIGYFPHAGEHLRERPHGAEQTIFICCSQGAGWCEMRGHRHAVPAGSLLIVPGREPHAYGADPEQPWTISWFHAVGSDIAPMLKELGADVHRPVVALHDGARWASLFDEALDTLEHGYTTAHLLHASRALGHLLSTTNEGRRRSRPSEPDARQKVMHCVDYMKQHLGEPLRLPQLAAMAGMSSSHFKARFRQHVGYSCIDYFIRLRMHRACQLLDTTDRSAKSIAHEVGYADPLWFSKAFRAVVGMPPSEYRRKHKG